MLPKSLSFVDIETTGANYNKDRIIEIGIVRVEDNKVIHEYKTLIDPGMHVPNQILEFTGITQVDLEKAPTFSQVKNEILEILADSVFVAHNVRFDYGFLKRELKRYDFNFFSKHFCTVQLSRMLYPRFRRHNLDALIQRHNIECSNRHRALDDAKVIWEFYKKVLQEFQEADIEKAIKFGLKRPSIPLSISTKDLDNLPECPGVYIFRGENGVPLYIGKSINIRQRVLNHFSNNHISPLEAKISKQIKEIETIQTAGELGALLTESELIKKAQPLYNRMLRNARKLVLIKQFQSKEGYESIEILESYDIKSEEINDVIAVFKSKKEAKNFLINKCKENTLCKKLLNIENSNKECFGYRLKKCNGACAGKEPAIKYNLRFYDAFLNHKLKAWPFKNPIIIKETNPISEKEEMFLVDMWCLVKKINNEDDLKEIVGNNLTFDIDTYKILASFILDLKNQEKIKILA